MTDTDVYSHWEMFWPVVSVLCLCALVAGWGLSPVLLGGTA